MKPSCIQEIRKGKFLLKHVSSHDSKRRNHLAKCPFVSRISEISRIFFDFVIVVKLNPIEELQSRNYAITFQEKLENWKVQNNSFLFKVGRHHFLVCRCDGSLILQTIFNIKSSEITRPLYFRRPPNLPKIT